MDRQQRNSQQDEQREFQQQKRYLGGRLYLKNWTSLEAQLGVSSAVLKDELLKRVLWRSQGLDSRLDIEVGVEKTMGVPS